MAADNYTSPGLVLDGDVARASDVNDLDTAVDNAVDAIEDIIYSGATAEHNADGSHSDVTVDTVDATSITVETFECDGTAATDFIVDTDTLIVDCAAHKVGVGTTSPGTILHVSSGNSGVSPNASYDDLFVENSTNAGITIGAGTASTSGIAFGDTDNATSGYLSYSHVSDYFDLTSTEGNFSVIFSNDGLEMSMGGAVPKETHLSIDSHLYLNAYGATDGFSTIYDSSTAIKMYSQGNSSQFFTIGNSTGSAYADFQFTGGDTFAVLGANGAAAGGARFANPLTFQLEDAVGIGLNFWTDGGVWIQIAEGSSGETVSLYTDVTVGGMTWSDTRDGNFIFDTAGSVGIGSSLSTLEAKLHVMSSNISLTPGTAYDDLYLENGSHCGMTIGSGTTATGNIAFGDADNGTQGLIQYNHSNDSLNIKVNASSAIYVDSTGAVGINTILPLAKLNVRSSSTSATPDGAYDEAMFENNANAGITIAAAAASNAGIALGSSTHPTDGQIRYSNSTRAMSFYTTGSSRLVIDSNGHVGVGGQSSADVLFHVQTSDSGATPDAGYDDLFVESSGNTGITIGSSNVGIGGIAFADNGGAVQGILYYDHNAEAMNIRANATTIMTIRGTTSRIGINNNTPVSILELGLDTGGQSNWLTIGKGFSSSSGIQWSRADIIDCQIYEDDSENMVFDVDLGSSLSSSFIWKLRSVESMRLHDTGELKIGSSGSPLGKLHVKTATSGIGALNSGSDELCLENNGNTGMTIASSNTGIGRVTFGDPDDADVGQIYYSHANDSFSFIVNASTVMTIDSAGQLGIGTTSPSKPLDIDGTQIRLRQSNTPASAGASGSTGNICWDTNYIYVCVAANTWKRAALSTW